MTLLQTCCQGKHYVLTMVEGMTGWLETYPKLYTTAWNIIFALEKSCGNTAALKELI